MIVRRVSQQLSFRMAALRVLLLLLAAAAQAQTTSMHLLTADTGWILTGNRLLWTSNAGTAWSDVTPKGAASQVLYGAFFLDTSRGWLLRASAPDAVLELAHSGDSGKTWSSTPVPLPSEDLTGFGGAASLHFIDSSHGWAMLRRTSSSNFSLGMLFRTSDGGATWQRLPEPPLGDPVRFVTKNDGWLAGGPAGNKLYVTRDGGSHWSPQTIAPPASAGSQAQVRYSQPVFENESNGILTARYVSASRTILAVYQTRDRGVTWQPRAVLPRAVSENSMAVSVVDSHVVTVSSDRSGAITTELDGQASKSNPAFSSEAAVMTADFASTRQGWVLIAEGQCQGFKTDCKQQEHLLATSNGGVTFQEITPPLLRSENTPPQVESAVNGSGQGFDLCSPTTADLQAWFTSSPYRYVNVYIGGVNAACVQPGLSQSWVNQVVGQGWGLIPTWVGLQAPCSSCTGCSAFSSNPTTAASQGTSEAQSAAGTMSSIGLSGTVVYYDLEQ